MFKRFLILAISLLLCAISGLETLSIGSKPTNSLKETRQHISDSIYIYMNESVDPCENFFEFACGNWKTYHPTNSSLTRTRAFVMAIEEMDPKIYSLMYTFDEKDLKSERKVQEFFYSCATYSGKLPSVKKYEFRTIISEFGQMPAVAGEKWQENDFDWLKTVAEISYKYGINIILGYSIAADHLDSSAKYISISNENFTPTNKSDLYEAILFDCLDVDEKVAREIANEVSEFEQMLFNASRFGLSVFRTLQGIHERYSPDLDIRRLMEISFGSIPEGGVYDNNPVYMDNLIDIMKTTPKKVVANYIFLRLSETYIIKSADAHEKNIQEGCLQLTKKKFPHILSNMIYRTNNLQEREQYVHQMWQDLVLNYELILESSNLHWFDDAAREYALEKLHSMKMEMPSYEVNNFDEEYSELHTHPYNFIGNLKSLDALNAKKNRASLNRAPQYHDLYFDLNSPYYAKLSNTVTIPISTLHSEFLFSSSQPKGLFHAHFGFLLAHEIIHGFSGAAREYNRLGIWQEMKQWDKEVDKEYKKRVECLYNQYRNYTFGGEFITWDTQQTENIADNLGLFLAYQTYRMWYEDDERTKEEIDMEVLPNLNYTNDQLFFIAYSQGWCADTWEGLRATIAKADSHTADEFRAFLPLKNSDEFSKAFSCPMGSTMNPVKKCKFYEKK